MLKKQIKQKRLERGLKIQELADMTGISAASISMYESGKRIPSIKNINKISDALKLKAEDLFDENYILMNSKENDLGCQEAYKRAAGKCELCGQNAPFITREGEPYLIQKFIYYESEERKYAFALCPNCHAKLCILPCEGEKIYLLKKILNKD